MRCRWFDHSQSYYVTREDEEEDAEMIGDAPPTLLPSAGGWLLTELSSNIPERFVPPGREAKVGYGSQQRGHPLALGEPSCLTTVSLATGPSCSGFCSTRVPISNDLLLPSCAAPSMRTGRSGRAGADLPLDSQTLGYSWHTVGT